MRERILIVDIGGSAGDLPNTTPATVRYVNWMPQVSTAANIPAPGGFAVKALTDAVLLTWARVAGQSVRYGIESALDVNGQPGSWQVVTETDALRYTASVPDAAARWWRVRAISLGKAGAYTAPLRAISISGADVQQAATNAQAAADAAQSGVDTHTAQLVHAQQERDRIARESLERDAQGALNAAADAKNKADAAREAAYLRAQTLFGEAIAAAAVDATIKANGARDAALARIDTIESQVADILSADAHSTSKTYPQGDLVQHADKLYRAKQAVPVGIAVTNTTYWEYIGDYTSLGEAVSACIAQAIENRTALGIERARLNGIASRMPAGTDGLATQTMVLDEMTERLSADEALAGRATLVEARLGGRIDNLVAHPNFEGGTAGSWSVGSVVDVADHPNRKKALQAAGSSYLPMSDAFDCAPGEVFDLRIDLQLLHASASARPQIQWWSKDGQVIGYASPPSSAHTGSTNWATGHAVSGAVAPAGAARGRPGVSITGAGARLTEFVITRRGDGMGVLDARITDVDNASVSRDSAIAGRVSNVEARMPAGAGKLATAASVTDAVNASAAANQATADRVTLVEARMPTGNGKLATQAGVNQAAAAAASATGAVADRVANVEARMPGGNGTLATEARVAGVESAASSGNQAIAARASQIEARLGGRVDNLVPQANFEDGRGIWTVGTVVDAVGHPHLTKALEATSSPYLPAKYNFDVAPGEIFDLQIDAKPVSALAQIAPNIQWLDKTGAVVGYASSASRGVRNTAEWVIGHTTTGHVAPAGAVRGRIGVSMTGGGGMFTNLVMTRRTPGMSALDARITEVAEASSNENGAIATRTSALEARANALERNADFSAAKAWEFDAGDEGWRERSGNTWIAPVHSNGAVRPERAVGRPLMLLSPALSGAAGIDGAKNNLLRFRFRTSHGRAASGLAIYFQTDAQGVSETTRVTYEIAPGAGWQVVTVDMSGNLHWIASPIRRIRIDNFGCANVGEYVEIDYVAVGTTGVGVSSGALAQVAASVTTAEEASVERDSALSNRITTADAKAGAAQAAATAAQQAVANETQARSQAIIGVQSRIDGQKGQSIGPNLLKNSRFDADVRHWTKHVKDMAADDAELVRNRGGDTWRLPDTNNLTLFVPTAKPTTAYVDARSAIFAVEPGKTYALAARIAAHRCVAKCYLVFLRANGTWRHAELVGESAGKTGGKDPNNWAHVSKAMVAPSDATQALFLFRLQVTNAVAADLHAWLTQPIICEVPAGTTVAPMYSAGSAEHAAAVLELKTEVDTAKNERRAIAGLYVTANGKIGGFRTISDGVTASFDVSADIFTVTSDAAQGLEWQAGCLRSYSGTSQAVLGHGFGEAGDLALYIGPNTGRAAARRQDATIWADKNGNAGFSGVIYGSVIAGSAMSLESLRIRCGNGKYAPFTICDTASDFSNSTAGTRVMMSTCSGFVAPNNGAGYHHKRFARHRQDVQMHVNLHTDHGWEDVVLEVQYNGGSWQTIAGTSIDGGHRNSATYLVRYTTIDSWQTVAFRARTIRGLTTCLTLRIDIANYNESGNPAGSNSNIFSPGGTGGQTPPPPPPPPRDPGLPPGVGGLIP